MITKKYTTPIHVYTDGGCMGPGKPGAWAYVILWPGHPDFEGSGYNPATTNNIMELTAAIEALKALPRGLEVVVTSDSQYVVKGWNEYLAGWIRRNWKKSDMKPVKNIPVWKAMIEAASGLKVTFKHVKGHSGHEQNERCDELCTAAMKAGMAT